MASNRFTVSPRQVVIAGALIFVVSLFFFSGSGSPSRVYNRVVGDSAVWFPPGPLAKSFERPVVPGGTLANPESKYAYVVYLAPTEKEDAGEEDTEDNVYLTSARLLTYQILHDPETRTNNSIPVVVLVSPQVSQSKRRLLECEGAWVAEFPSIELETVKADRPRWKHVMDKMNVFRLTQFEKVLLLDSDIVLFKTIDGVFEEPETDIQTNLGMEAQTKADEGVQPKRYLLAADSSPIGSDKHPWPAPRSKALNAGFMVLHPSEEMLAHYLKIGAIEGRTPMLAPENNLLEYVHRPDGNMPYSQLPHYWVMNHPVFDDYRNGIAAVHEKWWRNSMTDHHLKEMLLKPRWKMEGYWSRHGECSNLEE